MDILSYLPLRTLPHFDITFVSYFTLVAAVGHVAIRQNHRRIWVLSAFATTMISVLGSIELVQWILTHSKYGGDTAISHMLLEFFKAYLAVDLIYAAVWHPTELALVDGWIHHIVYIVVAEKTQQQFQVSCVRPFWIIEIPAAIRAWQAMGALSQQTANRWFGATFVAFRIAWPAYAVTQILAQDWLFAFIGLAIIVHTWWFAMWMKRQAQT
jgi:hypothetical protein